MSNIGEEVKHWEVEQPAMIPEPERREESVPERATPKPEKVPEKVPAKR